MSLGRNATGNQLAPTPSGSARTNLRVSGMTCQNCARHVGEALRSVAGVDLVNVRLEQGAVSVRWKTDADPNPGDLLSALEEAGYKGAIDQRAMEGTKPARWSFLEGWHFNVVAGLAVTIPLMILEWGFGFGTARWYQWLSFLLVLPIQVVGGLRFYLGAWNQLKKGQSNMDTLVAIGSTTAFLYSLWALFSHHQGHLFFMDAAAIISLVSLGHYLESKASAQAASSLKALMNLAPQTARKLGVGASEMIVPVAELEVGDRILLKPGDRVPTDGEVIEGGSSIIESMLTGESLPVEKAPGAKVFAGTINDSGQLTCRVTAKGEATALAHIIEIVERAQASRASIQRLGDRVSSIFVPVVVLIALAAAAWWGLAPESARAAHDWLAQFLWPSHPPGDPLASAVIHAAAVLIIACPCAMGLATPVAIMAGTNVAARRGILIRDGAALEKSGQITAVIFDKTGTLTTGKVALSMSTDLQTLHPEFSNLEVAAALARPSNHPLSKAIATENAKPVSIREWKEIRGSGVEGMITEETFRQGSFEWLKSRGVNTAPGEPFFDHWTGQGATVIGLARGNTLGAVFALRDNLKRGSAEVVRNLMREGKKVFMVTGDNPRTASAIATLAGIPKEHVFAGVRPEGKVEVIQRLQREGEKIAFAGDGINDAPALEQADLGIALTNASDVARESADIILLKADIEAIPEALGLAQATMRTIKQNLFWAFFYNAAGVPLAALGFLSPIFSAFAMGMSDLIVIGNALRLRFWRP